MNDRDEHVKQLDFSDEFYIERALVHYDKDDWLGVLKILNERDERYDPSADSTSMYAEAYGELGLYRLSADYWIRFLDTCNEEDAPEGYFGLGSALVNAGELQETSSSEETFDEMIADYDRKLTRNLRIVHTDGDDTELLLRDGSEALQKGDFEKARRIFSQVKPESKSYPFASGLIVMCLLMEGKQEEATAECEKLLSEYPEDAQGLTTYCTVLNATGRREEAEKIAEKLCTLEIDTPEENMHAGLALCESGLEEAGYQKFKAVRAKEPYEPENLYYLAVSCYRTGRLEEAIDALEMLTLIDHRKEVAKYFLERMRQKRDDPALEVNIDYTYKMPVEEREVLLSYFHSVIGSDGEQAKNLGDLPFAFKFFRMAFDSRDGRDFELFEAALSAAIRARQDKFLREILLDPKLDMEHKLEILKSTVLRNEDNSFGVVFYNFYKEFFTSKLELGSGYEEEFLSAFTEIYTKLFLIDASFEEKLLTAGEEVYEGIIEHGKTQLFRNKKEIGVTIVREAHVNDERVSLEQLAADFEADVDIVKDILDCVM